MKIEAFGAAGAPGAQSWFGGCQSCQRARAELRAGSSGSEGQSATSSCLAEKSWTAGGAAHAERREIGSPEEALAGIGSEGST